MLNYSSLSDPRGVLAGCLLKFPAEPALGGSMGRAEREALMAAFDESCQWSVGFRAFKEVEDLEECASVKFGYAGAVAVNGAGTATDLVLRALELNSSDEIICSAATFHGQHLSVLGTPAALRLADIDEETFCISATSVRELFNTRTRAVLATDLHGAPCDYFALRKEIGSVEFSGPAPLLIADAARSVPIIDAGSGSSADILILSMQSKKIWTALGEGGLILTNNQELLKKLRQYRSFGEGAGWGSNYKLSKLQAVVAHVQLNRLQGTVDERRALAQTRAAAFHKHTGGLTIVNSAAKDHCFSFFPIKLPSGFGRDGRDALIERLATTYGIGSVVANPPTYLYNRWIAERTHDRQLNAEELTDRLICLPLHPSMNAEDEQYIRSSFLDSFNSALL